MGRKTADIELFRAVVSFVQAGTMIVQVQLQLPSEARRETTVSDFSLSTRVCIGICRVTLGVAVMPTGDVAPIIALSRPSR